jgi:hypothetical protein
MGKAVPSLSWEALRQAEVRKQLAPSGRCTKWMQGHRGAKRAAARLKARRAPPPAACLTGWGDVPQHVQEAVLWRLSLEDLTACRLAGFGGRDPEWRARLRRVFLARVRSLGDVQRAFVHPGNARRGSGNVAVADGAAGRYKPVEFTQLDRLFCFTGGSAGLASGPAVPDGIGEMRKLTKLDVLGDVVKDLPDRLAQCTELKSLGLKGHGFVRLPPVVLRLRRLRVLGIAMCAALAELPEDIGSRLTVLSRLDIESCGRLQTLPDSVLVRLESSSYKNPLLMTTSLFPADYLDRVLCRKRFPKLRAKCAAAYPELNL